MNKDIILIITLISINCFSQKIKVSDFAFKEFAYNRAAELYNEVVKDGDSSFHVLSRLADSYYNISKPEKASFWYSETLKKYPNSHPAYIYKYIQTLRNTGQDSIAKKWLKKYKELKKDDPRAKDLNFGDTSPVVTMEDSTYVKLKNLSINTFYSDFGGYIYQDKFIFTSSRNFKEKSNELKKRFKLNDEPFLDLFQSTLTYNGEEANFNNVTPIKFSNVNTKFHEGTMCITNDGKTLYFTRDNVNLKYRIKFDKSGTSHLKIYKASLIDGRWGNAQGLRFNQLNYSNGHPALNSDNTKLYFTSDRKGGKGLTDIYYVAIKSNGSYGKPVNLGNIINTESREMFPFITKENILYFSSDGHESTGLLDIFKVDLNNKEAKVENIGKPFNSIYDDFSFFETPNTANKKGYISSNRPEGAGSDDIYEFEYITKAFPCKQLLTGTVRDSKTKLPIFNANVRLANSFGKIISNILTDKKGNYKLDVDCSKTYKITAQKEDYQQENLDFISSSIRNKNNIVDIYMKPLIQDNQIVLDPIYFDFEKWNIRPDAAFQLESVVTVMRKYPKMRIRIEAHTDSRGKDNFNLWLSDKRAKSTRNYLDERGISKNRILQAKGFGETKLINHCANYVRCSEEEHQLNRRSYFYILKK